jgi:hypothetical protein
VRNQPERKTLLQPHKRSNGKALASTYPEDFMSDNLENRGPQDRSRVNVNEEWEVRYWTKEFGVNEDQLRKAVQKVGPSTDAIRKELKAA